MTLPGYPCHTGDMSNEEQEMSETTVLELAREIDPSDPGRGAGSVIGFLGHLDGLDYDSVLDPGDVADVRAYWAGGGNA